MDGECLDIKVGSQCTLTGEIGHQENPVGKKTVRKGVSEPSGRIHVSNFEYFISSIFIV